LLDRWITTNTLRRRRQTCLACGVVLMSCKAVGCVRNARRPPVVAWTSFRSSSFDQRLSTSCDTPSRSQMSSSSYGSSPASSQISTSASHVDPAPTGGKLPRCPFCNRALKIKHCTGASKPINKHRIYGMVRLPTA
jgi:hypothetical protein